MDCPGAFHYLLGPAGADQRGGDPGIPQYPGKGHLGQALAAFFGNGVEPAYSVQFIFAEKSRVKGLLLAGAASTGNFLEVLIGKRSVGKRGENNDPDAQLFPRIEQSVLVNPEVQQGVTRLVDETGGTQLFQN